MRHRQLSLFTIAVVIWAGGLRAADWPGDYVIQENTASPDGKHALIVRSRESATDNEPEDNPVYLADVGKHIAMGEVEDVNYFQGQNHRDLSAYWNADSTWCVVQNDARFGFDSIHVLELKNDSFTQTVIGKQIEKSVNQLVAKQAHDPQIACDITPYFKLGPDQILRVRAAGTTNPKELESVKSFYGYFSGIYDLKSRHWDKIKTLPIDQEILFGLSDALDGEFEKHMMVAPNQSDVPETFRGTVFPTEEEQTQDLDRRLNATYQVVRKLLSKEQFESVKRDQVKWLAKRDRAGSPVEKSKLMIERIHQLQDLLWVN